LKNCEQKITREFITTNKDFKQFLFANFPLYAQEALSKFLPEYIDNSAYIYRTKYATDFEHDRLFFVQPDDTIVSIGCYNCLAGKHTFDTKKQLWINKTKAIPATKELSTWPAELSKIQMDSLNIWICPFCKQIITRWKIGI
jgi:hypothetical protein